MAEGKYEIAELQDSALNSIYIYETGEKGTTE